MKMTASELKYQYQAHGNGHYFDRGSMKFFGDTMANYYVPSALVKITTYSGDIKECYQLERRRAVKMGRNDTAYFDTSTFDVVRGEL